MVIKEITWMDSSITEEQTDEVAEPCTIISIGYLVKETKEYITLARDKIKNEWRGQISIPKVAIIDDILKYKK